MTSDSTRERESTGRRSPASFSDRVAVVTGAASGIGWALSRGLAESGARVVLMDVDRDLLESRVADLRSAGREAEGAVVDVTSNLPEALRRTAAGHGRLDYVFNNAGVGATLSLREADDDDWGRLMALDLDSVIAGTRTAYQLMRAQGSGHIVNTASISGLVPFPGQTLYNTAKFAIVGLSTTLRPEAAADGVKVSVVCPGAVATPIWGTPIRGDRSDSAAPPGAITAEDAAGEILNGVLRDRAVIVVPRSARRWDAAYRHLPRTTAAFLAWRARRGG